MIELHWQAAWEALIHHPLFGVAITLAVFQLAYAAYEKTRWVFLQPVLVSMTLIVGILLPVAVFALAFWLGRRRDVLSQVLLYLAGLGTVAALSLSLVALFGIGSVLT